jgi:hypothetical protein
MAINGSNIINCRRSYHIWRQPMRRLGNSMRLGHRIEEVMKLIEKTKESWHEAEVNRTAGEIALNTNPQ